ncbi:MAG: hypothetical protein GY810_26815 [Aureispira sp.]|nr:hypothetical protein [Aureispira sp.]
MKNLLFPCFLFLINSITSAQSKFLEFEGTPLLVNVTIPIERLQEEDLVLKYDLNGNGEKNDVELRHYPDAFEMTYRNKKSKVKKLLEEKDFQKTPKSEIEILVINLNEDDEKELLIYYKDYQPNKDMLLIYTGFGGEYDRPKLVECIYLQPNDSKQKDVFYTQQGIIKDTGKGGVETKYAITYNDFYTQTTFNLTKLEKLVPKGYKIAENNLSLELDAYDLKQDGMAMDISAILSSKEDPNQIKIAFFYTEEDGSYKLAYTTKELTWDAEANSKKKNLTGGESVLRFRIWDKEGVETKLAFMPSREPLGLKLGFKDKLYPKQDGITKSIKVNYFAEGTSEMIEEQNSPYKREVVKEGKVEFSKPIFLKDLSNEIVQDWGF